MTAHYWGDVKANARATDAERAAEYKRQRDAYKEMVRAAWKIIAIKRPDLTNNDAGLGFVECVEKAVCDG